MNISEYQQYSITSRIILQFLSTQQYHYLQHRMRYAAYIFSFVQILRVLRVLK